MDTLSAELHALKTRWAHDLQSLAHRDAALAKSQALLTNEREARVDAESRSAASQARLSTLESVFAKWEAWPPPDNLASVI